jgi:hypothetical protein
MLRFIAFIRHWIFGVFVNVLEIGKETDAIHYYTMLLITVPPLGAELFWLTLSSRMGTYSVDHALLLHCPCNGWNE